MKMMNVTQFAEYVGTSKQNISEKICGKKALASGLIKYKGKYWKYERISPKCVFFYVDDDTDAEPCL